MLNLFCFSDELSGILKKLSLEKYHPIFEEQEVCKCQLLGFGTINTYIWRLLSFGDIGNESK